MKLALGTAQFGLAYGIANTTGQVSAEEIAKILNRARAMGIDTVDTAIAYGESEKRLGEAGVQGLHIVSKLPAMPNDCANIQAWVDEHVNASLTKLKVPHLHGLLLHRPGQLLEANGSHLYNALLELKRAGKVSKIGISIYDPIELDDLCARYTFDLVQAPFNVLDRRLATSGWLQRLDTQGIEIHVRSVFLQGLLLSPSGKSPAGFERWEPVWSGWRKWLHHTGLSPLQAALQHALSFTDIDRVIVGIDSLQHLNEILDCANTKERQRAPENLTVVDSDLLNPARWATFF